MGETHSDPLASAPVATQHRFLLPLLTLLLCSCCVILHGQSLQPQGTPPRHPAARTYSSGPPSTCFLKGSTRRLKNLPQVGRPGAGEPARTWASPKSGRHRKRMRTLSACFRRRLPKYPTRVDLHFGIANLASRTARYDLAIAEFQLRLTTSIAIPKGAAGIFTSVWGKPTASRAISISRLPFCARPNPCTQPTRPSRTHWDSRWNPRDKCPPPLTSTAKSSSTDPNNASALNNLAFLLAARGGNPSLALAYAHRARQMFPNEPTIIDTLGWVYLKLNRADDAIPLFRTVVQKDPRSRGIPLSSRLCPGNDGRPCGGRKESDAGLKSNPSKDDEQKINEPASEDQVGRRISPVLSFQRWSRKPVSSGRNRHGTTVMVPDRVHPPIAAVIATGFSDAVVCVAIWKAARDAPAGSLDLLAGRWPAPGSAGKLHRNAISPCRRRKASRFPTICAPPLTLAELNASGGMHPYHRHRVRAVHVPRGNRDSHRGAILADRMRDDRKSRALFLGWNRHRLRHGDHLRPAAAQRHDRAPIGAGCAEGDQARCRCRAPGSPIGAAVPACYPAS